MIKWKKNAGDCIMLELIKKIDIHAHCAAFPDYVPRINENGLHLMGADEVIDFYDKLNVERGILLPITAPDAFWHTMTSEGCAHTAKTHPDRFSWFCGVDPRALENSSDSNLGILLEHYKSLGAIGCGELTANIYADDKRIDNLFGYCAEFDLPVTIHIAHREGGCYGIIDELGLPRIRKMMKKHPKLKIFGHSMCFWSEIGENNDEIRHRYPKGKVQNGLLREMLYENENLFCDMSAGSGANAFMRDREHAAKFMEEFSDRLLYGCDACTKLYKFAFDFDEFLTSMRENGEIKDSTYRKIVRENAIRILNL